MSPPVRRLAALASAVVVVVVVLVVVFVRGGGSKGDVVACGAIKATGANTAELRCDSGDDGADVCSKNRTECTTALGAVVKVCHTAQASLGDALGNATYAARNLSAAAAEAVRSLPVAAKDKTEAAARAFAECVEEASPMVINAGSRRPRTLAGALAVFFYSNARLAELAVQECTPEEIIQPAVQEKAMGMSRMIAECLSQASLGLHAGRWNADAHDHDDGSAFAALPRPSGGLSVFTGAAFAVVALSSLAAAYSRSRRRNARDLSGTELGTVMMVA